MKCPDCLKLGFDDREEVEMREVGDIKDEDVCGEGCCRSNTRLYQCPKCKRVEIE